MTNALPWLAIAACAAAAGTARADAGGEALAPSELAAAIAHHADADVAGLRGHLAQVPGDAALRCALGVVYAARKDLPRAHLYLDRCEDAQLPGELAAPVADAAHAVAKALRASDLSAIDIITTPEGATAEIDAMPGDEFQTPMTIWVAAGHHVVTAKTADGHTAQVPVDSVAHSRGPLLISLAAPAAPTPQTGTVDMSDDGGLEAQSGPPPDVVRPTLLPERFRNGGATGGPSFGDDFDADAMAHAPPSRWRFGGRFGGGVFDHGGANARISFDAGALAELVLAPRWMVVGRIDWSRRGGTAGATNGVDAIGATIGPSIALVQASYVELHAGAGLRTAVAVDDTMDASRATFGAAAWLELPLRRTPIVFGVRGEQGITTFAGGARDQAIIAELGVDLP